MRLDQSLRANVADVALAVVVTMLVVLNSELPFSVDVELSALDYVLMVTGSMVLAFRRRAPVAVLVTSAVLLLGYFFRAHPDSTAAVPVLVALYTAVRAGHRLPGIAVAAAFLVGTFVDHLWQAGDQPFQELLHQFAVLPMGWFVASVVLAEVTRQREHVLEQRALAAERSRDDEARRRAQDERLRIARELHDSLTHSISVIKVQSGVAAHLAQKRGEPVPAALMAIQEASSDATRELRDTLGVLRADGEPPPSGLDRLPDLVDRVRVSGLEVTLTVDGVRRDLPADVDRAAYRIVQEALTNVGRHAQTSAARVRISYRPSALAVQIDDDGVGDASSGAGDAGMGLLGMRERVVELSGTFDAGPRPGGGFRVSAELPVGEAL